MAIPGLDALVPGLLTARHAGGSILLGGIDILANVSAQNVIGFSYGDMTNDKADDLTVVIADPDRSWMASFLPKKGVEIESTIRVFNWTVPGDTRDFNVGTMWIDELILAGPPNIVTVKATSIPVHTGIKTEKQYQFWEDQPLQQVASEIAGIYDLALVWETSKDPKLKRSDVIEQSHLEYLVDRCKDEGLNLKLFNRQLIIYSQADYEARPAVYTLTYGMSQILHYDFTSRLNETFVDAENSYVNPETGRYLLGTFAPAVPPEGSGSHLKVQERVEDAGGADAEPETRAETGMVNTDAIDSEAATEKAKNKLRDKNKREKECIMMVVGNPGYLSGLNAELSGWGTFDGKWHIHSSIHDISEDGYTTELRMRKCLEGY